MEADGRHVTGEPLDPRERFSLYVLCPCILCDSRGKVKSSAMPGHVVEKRCPECRGEGRTRVELATADSPEAVGVALVTLAREGEWLDADGNPCAFGLLDRMGETGKKWLVSPWSASTRNVSDAAKLLRAQRKTDAQPS